MDYPLCFFAYGLQFLDEGQFTKENRLVLTNETFRSGSFAHHTFEVLCLVWFKSFLSWNDPR
jgi:hypothetical protein